MPGKILMRWDLTAYYFPGYPNVPADDYVFDLKRKAIALGLEIIGTGIRKDFTSPDKSKRNENIELVKNWVIVAEKLGTPESEYLQETPVSEKIGLKRHTG